MTKRTRISRKAQARRRREFELCALWGVQFDTFYGNGYWYVSGVDFAGPDNDQIAVVVFVKTPDNKLILHDTVRPAIQRAVYRIQSLDYLALGEKYKALHDYTLAVLQNVESGQSAWARLLQKAITDSITDKGES